MAVHRPKPGPREGTWLGSLVLAQSLDLQHDTTGAIAPDAGSQGSHNERVVVEPNGVVEVSIRHLRGLTRRNVDHVDGAAVLIRDPAPSGEILACQIATFASTSVRRGRRPSAPAIAMRSPVRSTPLGVTIAIPFPFGRTMGKSAFRSTNAGSPPVTGTDHRSNFVVPYESRGRWKYHLPAVGAEARRHEPPPGCG